ncbi:hypothetical protein RchiOBHm_Chr1g0359101 [Rosa chinensis]|uniref:Glucosamine inositolphosphorylceramide transferase 1 N-terminal domain-containing protein n=1 Tax=Rosa chinensis TaxID=74649 RepID=A0A2P6SIB5_ROSCH|nr:hypothetical protein RchiOBHm_Chr1g0359101 [Rosa chinensis]
MVQVWPIVDRGKRIKVRKLKVFQRSFCSFRRSSGLHETFSGNSGGSVATIYVWFAFTPYYYARSMAESSSSATMLGCQEDNEGSWSIGVFFDDSPFNLKPIEAGFGVLTDSGFGVMNVWRDKSAAWPVANPVVTCASVSESGFPSNFVADPFLYVQVIALVCAEIYWLLQF